ncbi:transcriptional regulator [Dietzia sp. CH92]|uniref:transcriptional regulator n=1 Tax=Dietzia sp. CH92 TaxID=3051823 RepID=UPI0028D33F4E|nr:transcriptional regulator [Dietzia sp. CH92]
MSSEPTARDLVELVTSIPGVCGLEPGIGTTLRTLDARVRRVGGDRAHFGLNLDRPGRAVTVEVSVDRSRPIRDIVRDIQAALQDALAGSVPAGVDARVRVQSLDTHAGRASFRLGRA